MSWSLKLGRVFGIPVYLHWTFLILIVWLVIAGTIENNDLVQGLSEAGFVLALFGCVLLHEFGHALTARRFGVATTDVTLLPIGGVARLERMPEKPSEELAVALAGPAVNLAIVILLLVFGVPFPASGDASADLVHAGFWPKLLLINVFLGGFNRFDGELHHHPYRLYVRKSERGKGVGAEVHGRRVAFGAEHGVQQLKITAARGDEEIGYVVWPAMGYDGKLPKDVVAALPEQLRGRTTIQELLSDEGGQKWWKKNGRSMDMIFDLGPGSLSIRRWTAYWTRKSGGSTGK